MGIYRGAGGTGDAVNDASSEATLVQELVSGATMQANNAATSATAAQAASTQAAISQGLAQDAATAAATAETNAETAETNAETAQAAAEAAQTAAEAAQTAAELAETNAETAETNAETAETNAETAASLAQEWATKLSTPVSGSDYSAKYNANLAATSATNASNSATAAAGSASTASSAADAALAALDSFDDRYLGQKSTAPTLDNDGNALLAGALYFNTTTNEMKVYDGSTWLNAYASLSGALLATNNLSDLNNTATARTNLGLGTGNSPTFTGLITGAGTVSAPSITTTGDTNTGIFFPAADTISFTEGGVESMRIDSSGNLGIGTTSPAAKLDVSNSSGRNARIGGIQISGTSASADAGNNFVSSGSFWNGTNWTATATTAVNHQLGNGISIFYTDSGLTAGNTFTATERMRIDSSGNVGIGTSSPDARLSVNGIASFGDGAASTPSIANFGDLNTGFWFPAADTIAASTNGSERMRLDSVGNLGLGVTPSPWNSSAKAIDIAGFSSIAQTSSGSLANSFNAYQNSAGNWIYKTTNAASQYQTGLSGTAAHAWYTAPSGTAGNTITFTQAMTLNASGNLGIGTNSPNGRLDVTASIATASITSSSTTAGNQPTLRFQHSGNNVFQIKGGADLQFLSDDGANERMRITTAGNVGIGITNPAYKLQVSGTQGTAGITSTTAGQTPYLILNNTADSSNSYIFCPNKQLGLVQSDTSASSIIYLSTQNTERMRITSAGSVGIGTSSPAYNLSVYNATSSTLGVSGDATVAAEVYRTSTDASGAFYMIRKGRGTNASPTAVASGDNAGEYLFGVYGGTTNRTIGRIRTTVDTYTSDSNISSYMSFFTSPSGSAAGTEQMRITSAGLLQFNSGYGSVANAYGCRAWVNFNGTGTVAIRASGNVTSITDGGTGIYTVNFTVAMPDTNYVCNATAGDVTTATGNRVTTANEQATGNVQIRVTLGTTAAAADTNYVGIAIFR
jgi:hypothetical protein